MCKHKGRNKMSLTLDENGTALTETIDGVTMPVDWRDYD
jgi:hypothetical protein